MQFVCLCYTEEGKLESMPENELDVLFEDQVACDAELRQNGSVLASESLDSVRTAATVRVRDGELSVTDGPFAETKEQLGGFFLIEAEDMDHAIRIAAKFPSVRVGSMEIRPVWDIRRYVRERKAATESAVEAGH